MSGVCNCDCKICQRKKSIDEDINGLTLCVGEVQEKPSHLFGNPSFSDFKIIAGNKTFHVVKYVFAMQSTVFEKIILANNETAEGILRLDDAPRIVEAFLEYIYLGKKVVGSYLARKVASLAKRFDVAYLMDHCELEIINKLKMENVRECILFALEFEMSLLFIKCNEILYMNFSSFDDLTVVPRMVSHCFGR